MNQIYVFGHKNPDSDTICSALAYAYLKQRLDINAVAYKLGELNSETKFILQYFHVDPPQTLDTIKTQISDLMIDDPLCISSDMTIRAAWKYMKEYSQKAVSVVDSDNRLIGLVTQSDITRNFIDASGETLLLNSQTPYMNIIETLEADVLTDNVDKRIAQGRIMIAAQHHTKLKDYVEHGDIVVANIHKNINESILMGAGLIICTCGVHPQQADLALAIEKGCVVISTQFDTLTSAMLIRQSLPVRYVMTHENVVTVGLNELKEDVKERMIKTRYRSYPVLGDDKKVVGMVSRYHLLSKNRKQAILVDHNEKSQTAAGIEEAQIIEIIDHHRLGDIQTTYPIFVKNDPVGSTSTIIACLFEEYHVDIPHDIAGILLSAIISDTLNFRSPTCTDRDAAVANRLAAIAEVDINDLAVKIFSAGSKISNKTPDEIITSDLKEYALGKYNIGISQVYSIDSENLMDMRASLIERMYYFCDKNGYALLMLLVTDLKRGGSDVLSVGDRTDLLSKAYLLDPADDTVFLPGVLSRKKQVFPQIMSVEEMI